MSPFQQLVDSFAELVEVIPTDDAVSTINRFLDTRFANQFQDLDLAGFCRFLLDNLKNDTPFAGLAVALREMTDHLSLQFSQFLPTEEIQESLIQFNLLKVADDGRLKTADGYADAKIFFGNCSYLLIDGYLLTEIEGKKFQDFEITNMTQDLLVTGIFEFKNGPMAVINSKIQNRFGDVTVTAFHGEVIDNSCYGVARSKGASYIVCDNEIIERIDLKVTACLALSLNDEGLMRAIIQAFDSMTSTFKNHFIENNQLQDKCGDADIATLSNLNIDRQGNITGFVSNHNLPEERSVIGLTPSGETENTDVPNLLPFANGLVFEEIAGKQVDYLIDANFYNGRAYGKFMIDGQEQIVLREQLITQIEGTGVIDLVLDEDFSERGGGILVLTDDTCIQLDKGKLIQKISEQEVFDYRNINTFNPYPKPNGFFFDGVSWFLALNGNEVACPINDPNYAYSFNVEAYDYQAEVGSNGKLNYAGLVNLTSLEDNLTTKTREVLIINGRELAPTLFAGEIRTFTKYSDLTFNALGHVFCELEAEDGVIAYYANGEILNPKDYFLLSGLCLAKQEIIDYLKYQTDFFEQVGDVDITEISNYRLGSDHQRYFSFKYDNKAAILLGGLVITENETINDLVLDVSEPNFLHFGFTNKGTTETYGYGVFPTQFDF